MNTTLELSDAIPLGMNMLVLAGADRVLVWKGRGGYSDIRKHSVAEILDKFDNYAAWSLAKGFPTSDIDCSAAARGLVLQACEEGRIIADALDAHRGVSS